MKFGIFLPGLFKRRKFGPLSASPFGLAVFISMLIAVPVVFLVIFSMWWQDMSIQATRISPVWFYTRPIAEEARQIREKTGKWPASLNDIEAAKAMAPRFGRTLLLGDGEVRFVFTNPHPFGNADASLSLQVVARGDEHFLECRAEGRFRFALPRFCRSSAEPLRVQWPPESAKAAK